VVWNDDGDIDDRKRAGCCWPERRLLEMIAGAILVFSYLMLMPASRRAGQWFLSSILLLDPNTNRLRHGAALSLPIDYT